MKKILATALLATTLIASIPSTYAAYNDVDTLFRKTNYKTKTATCKNERQIKEVIRDIKVAEIINDGIFSNDPAKLEYFKQQAADPKNLVDYTMPLCDSLAETIVLSADNKLRASGNNSTKVVSESLNTTSGNSFYSQTLNANVGVISAADMFALQNSMSNYDFIVKKDNNNNGKLYIRVPGVDDITSDRFGAFSEMKFKFTKWVPFSTKKKGNYMKLGNSYYVTAQK